MIRRRDLLKSAVVVATGGLAHAELAAAAPETDAQTLLRKMVQAYASMGSYEDSGTVTRYDGGESPYRIEFTTSFKSPSLFRFGFARPHPYPPLHDIVTKYDVGFDGTAAYFLIQQHEKPLQSVPTANLDQALARATGISAGAAHTMSRLLLRDISGLSVLDLIDARMLADTPINGVDCYSVSAQHPRSGGEWVFSIEKPTLLMRKLKSGLGNDSGWFSEEVHEYIRVNQPVDESRFKV